MTVSCSAHRRSYLKTVALASLLSAVLSGVSLATWAYLPRAVFGVLFILLSIGIVFLGVVVAGGLLCLYRDHREFMGQPDLFYALANRPLDSPKSMIRRVVTGMSRVCGGWPEVGEVVQIRSAADILQTLDADGTIDGLPFMPEMLRFCGAQFRVFRWADKINDMNTKTGVRRLRDTVMLEELRCDGSAHDGCQAECQMLWKTAWLERVSSLSPVRHVTADAGSLDIRAAVGRSCDGLKTKKCQSEKDGTVYFCQMTELLGASEAMKWWDCRQDLRSLFYGNIGFVGFLVAALTRMFNTVQTLRGGCDYPFRPASHSTNTPIDDLGLKPGDRVLVKSKDAIAMTLDGKDRNRGLRYDREMVRFSGGRFVVRRRVSHIIGEDSGRMLAMKTPCITLEGATATGEFLRFCPQNEFVFFREIWLQRDSSAPQPGSS